MSDLMLTTLLDVTREMFLVRHTTVMAANRFTGFWWHWDDIGGVESFIEILVAIRQLVEAAISHNILAEAHVGTDLLDVLVVDVRWRCQRSHLDKRLIRRARPLVFKGRFIRPHVGNFHSVGTWVEQGCLHLLSHGAL